MPLGTAGTRSIVRWLVPLALSLAPGVVSASAWTGSEHIDRMTDFAGWIASTQSLDGGEAELVVRCRANHTDVFISTQDLLELAVRGTTPVMLRFGRAQALSQSWSLSADGRAAFAPERIAMARQLAAGADRLLVRVRTARGFSVDLEFSLEGARQEIETVATRCGWDIDAPPAPAVRAAPAPGAGTRAVPALPPPSSPGLPFPAMAEAEAALARQVGRYFVPPEGIAGAGTLHTILSFHLSRDGRLADRPRREVPTTGVLDPAGRALEIRALRAVLQAGESGVFAATGGGRLRVGFTADGEVWVGR